MFKYLFRLKIGKQFTDFNQFIMDFMEQKYEVFLFPKPPSSMESAVSDFFKHSEPVGQFSSENIFSRTFKEEFPIFDYFNCFPKEIWLGLCISLLAICITNAIMKKSLMAFFSSFWTYSTIILSDCIKRKPLKIK